MEYIAAVLCVTTLFGIPADISCQRIALAINEGCYVSDEIPIHRGRVDYQAFVTGSRLFCDKSLLIPKLLLDEQAKIISLTYPRRWGKSVALEMIRSFIQHETDAEGNIRPSEKTDSYKIFKEGRLTTHGNVLIRLENPLLIAQHDDFFRQYHAKYPVIYLDFSGVTGRIFDIYYTALRKEIAHAFRCQTVIYEHFHKLATSDDTPKYEKERGEMMIKKFLDITSEDVSCGEENLLKSVLFLSELMNEFYGQKVYILIDDYDLPLTYHYIEKTHDADIGHCIRSYISFLKETLGNNPFMERAILTGTVPLHEQEFISVGQSVKQHNILTSPVYEFFGFTQNELDAAFEYLEIEPELRQQYQHLHYGYRLRRNSDLKLYNPSEVAKFLHTRNLTTTSWIKGASYKDFIQTALHTPSLENALSILLINASYPIHLSNLRFNDGDLDALNYMRHHTGKSPTKVTDGDVALRYLFAIGYLTLSDNFTHQTDPSETYFRIPNRQVYSDLRPLVLEHFRSKFLSSGSNFEEYLKNISYHLESYASQNMFLGNDLTNAIESYLKRLQPFNEIQKGTKGVIRGNNATVRSLFNHILLYTDYFQFIPHDFAHWKNESLRSELAFRIHKNRGCMFELRFDRQFEGSDLLNDNERCKTVFHKYQDIYIVKLIGINVRKNRTVQVCGVIYHNAIDPKIKQLADEAQANFGT